MIIHSFSLSLHNLCFILLLSSSCHSTDCTPFLIDRIYGVQFAGFICSSRSMIRGKLSAHHILKLMIKTSKE